MLANAFGGQQNFGDIALRDFNLDRVRALFENQLPYNLHQHKGSMVLPDLMHKFGVLRGIIDDSLTLEEFKSQLLVRPGCNLDLDSYLLVYKRQEDIQSGPLGVEFAATNGLKNVFDNSGKSISQTNGEVTENDYFKLAGFELRYNPLKRNLDKKYKLSVIQAAIDQSLIPLNETIQSNTGIIVCLAKDLNEKHGITTHERDQRNLIIAERARRWFDQGSIVGIDIAGPESTMTFATNEEINLLERWISLARKTERTDSKIGVTLHLGETPHTSVDSFIKVIEKVNPDRIGHGIYMAKASLQGDSRALECLARNNITLEICPFSNLTSGAVENFNEMRLLLEELDRNKVQYVFATDGTAIHSFGNNSLSYRGHEHRGVTLADEILMLWLVGTSEAIIKEGIVRSHEVTFLNRKLDSAQIKTPA